MQAPQIVFGLHGVRSGTGMRPPGLRHQPPGWACNEKLVGHLAPFWRDYLKKQGRSREHVLEKNQLKKKTLTCAGPATNNNEADRELGHKRAGR